MINRAHKVTFIGISLVAALCLIPMTGMSTEPAYGTIVPEGAKAGDLVISPCDVYHDFDKRTYPGDCGTLVVPENRKNPKSRLIALPVTRIKSTGTNPLHPIFWFQGGPGSPNEMEDGTSGMLERHDLVMVGYRGIDGQVKLECEELADAIASLTENWLNESALSVYQKGGKDCVNALKSRGIDMAGYTMAQTIDDMEAARQALGYNRINVVGESYGTRLAMIYQWRYPESLHRVLMVAVNPPGHFVFEPVAIEKLFKKYSVLCAKDAYCSSRTPDLMATLKEVSTHMPESWMGIPIHRDLILMGTTFMMMESVAYPGDPVPVSGPAAIDMWLDAAEGDASGMALASLAMPIVLSNFTGGHFYSMGLCDYQKTDRDYKNELMLPGNITGSPMSLLYWAVGQGWSNHCEEDYPKVLPSDIETLLINGNIDGSTFVQFARDELLPYLKNGHLVILKDIGHTVSFWNSQTEARSHLINTFFESGQVDDSHYTHQSVVFDIDSSWDGLVTKLIIVLIVILIVLILLIFFIIRSVRKRLDKRAALAK